MLDAGRELDALVATKVMQWHNDGDAWRDAGDEWMADAQDWLVGAAPFCPSTDIAAAWPIVNKADEFEMWNHTGKQFGCRLIMGKRDGMGTGETAPLAICRAALAAVGAKVPI